jgi:hypothetical protein
MLTSRPLLRQVLGHLKRQIQKERPPSPLGFRRIVFQIRKWLTVLVVGPSPMRMAKILFQETNAAIYAVRQVGIQVITMLIFKIISLEILSEEMIMRSLRDIPELPILCLALCLSRLRTFLLPVITFPLPLRTIGLNGSEVLCQETRSFRCLWPRDLE